VARFRFSADRVEATIVTQRGPTNRAEQPDDPGPHPKRSLPEERLRALADAFGNTGLAKLIGVSASTPGRWISGQHRPRPQSMAQLIALDQTLTRASLIWGPPAVQEWLQGNNSHLAGARPIDALRHGKTSAVLAALDTEMWGGTS
jgi:hypothetical protein